MLRMNFLISTKFKSLTLSNKTFTLNLNLSAINVTNFALPIYIKSYCKVNK